MIKKLGFGVLMAGVVMLATMAIAPAAGAEAGSGDVALRGRGTLDAHGTGVMAVKGRLELNGNANRGVLLVKDIAGDAVVDVAGVGGSGAWNGFDVYYGSGAAHITGSDVAVIIVGTDIDVRVHGKGWAFLKGRGVYFVNGHGPLPWSEAGAFAGVDDGAADPPPEQPAN